VVVPGEEGEVGGSGAMLVWSVLFEGCVGVSASAILAVSVVAGTFGHFW
jgi:hypothetical protein